MDAVDFRGSVSPSHKGQSYFEQLRMPSLLEFMYLITRCDETWKLSNLSGLTISYPFYFLTLSVCMSVCLSVSLSLSLSLSLSISLFLCFSFSLCLFLYLCLCLFLSLCLFFFLYFYCCFLCGFFWFCFVLFFFLKGKLVFDIWKGI